MSNNYIRQARVDGIWGAVPDRRELQRNAGPTAVTVIAPATATTATPYQTQLEQLYIQQDTSSE